MTVRFELVGQEFITLNGGPQFQFTPAVSFFVTCFWEKLSENGKTNVCGWLTDKFGLTWQVVPAILGKLLQGQNVVKSIRVMEAVRKMDKLNISGLLKAYERN